MYYKHGQHGYEGAVMARKQEHYIDWSEHELTNIEQVNKHFSVGKVRHGKWVLYHTETLQAVSIGLKRDMRKLAKELLTFDHDVATATWSKHAGSLRYQVRSKTALTPERSFGRPGKVYREYV